MTNPINSTPFRFLELPPELGNRTYFYVFEDPSERELDLRRAQQLLPESSITLACREIRNESLGLSKEATSMFWKAHIFAVQLNCCVKGEVCTKRILDTCAQLPHGATIYGLAFTAHNLYGRTNLIARVTAEQDVSSGVEWSVFMAPSTGYPASLLGDCQKVFKMALQSGWLVKDRASALKRTVKEPSNTRGLDIEKCVAIVCDRLCADAH